MSSLFSDPQFPRGTTLLNGETIDYSDAANTIPTAGGEVIGQVKVFQDVNPVTKQKLSNRLVYCIAARYIGSSNLNVSGADKGKSYLLDTSNPTATFQTAAVATDANGYKPYAVLDEYLGTTEVRKNDIVWLVIKGPATVAKSTGTALVSGSPTMMTASGAMTAWTTTNIPTGYALAAAASADTTGRVYLVSDEV
jgi:hypothetical protein